MSGPVHLRRAGSKRHWVGGWVLSAGMESNNRRRRGEWGVRIGVVSVVWRGEGVDRRGREGGGLRDLAANGGHRGARASEDCRETEKEGAREGAREGSGAAGGGP